MPILSLRCMGRTFTISLIYLIEIERLCESRIVTSPLSGEKCTFDQIYEDSQKSKNFRVLIGQIFTYSNSLQGVFQGQPEGDVHSGRYHHRQELQEGTIEQNAIVTQKKLEQFKFKHMLIYELQ